MGIFIKNFSETSRYSHKTMEISSSFHKNMVNTEGFHVKNGKIMSIYLYKSCMDLFIFQKNHVKAVNVWRKP